MTLTDHILDFENKFNLPEGFFDSLLKEDDWSFIIKIHSFVEAVCTDALTYHFGESKLRETLAQLELGNSKVGKIAFLEEVGLITSEKKRIIMELSKLRNSYVHRIDDVSKSLTDKYSKLDKNQKKNFLVAFPNVGAEFLQVLKELLKKKKHVGLKEKLRLETLYNYEISDIQNDAGRPIDIKLQIWSAVWGLMSHFNEIKGFSDYRHWEKSQNGGA